MRSARWPALVVTLACYGEPTRPADTLVAHMTGAYRVSMAGRDGHTACPEAIVRISRDTLTWEGCSGPAVGSGVRPGRRDGGLGEIELGVWINYVDGEQTERRFVRKFLFNTFVGTAVRAEAEWTGPCINAMSVFPDACGVESGFATWVND